MVGASTTWILLLLASIPTRRCRPTSECLSCGRQLYQCRSPRCQIRSLRPVEYHFTEPASTMLTSLEQSLRGQTLIETMGLTADQIYSTMSYQLGTLGAVRTEYVDVRGWDFAGKSLWASSTFYGGQASMANFADATLTGATFNNATLTSAVFAGATAPNARFETPTLRGPGNFEMANASSATFRNANLSSASLQRQSGKRKLPGGDTRWGQLCKCDHSRGSI